MFKYLDRGKTHADNLIDNLLSFNVGSTWTTVGTGTALIDNNEYFEGTGSLRLTNNAYKTTELTANNSVQSTVIPFDGTYDFSLYLKKTLAEDMSVDVEIYNNASLVYGTTFTFSDVDNWTSFITNENFSFLKGDEITFRFKINNNASSAVTSASLWIDGLHLYNKERNQLEAPIFKETINKPEVTVTGGAQYVDGTYTSGSPLVILEGNTAQLTCDASTIVDNNIPSDFGSGMWDNTTNKLLAVNQKDWFDLEIRFKAENSENNGYFDIFLDIGGAVGELSRETQIFSRLSGTEQSFKANFDYYSGSIFISNGCTINISADKGDLSIYDIEILPFRKHKGY